MAKRGEQFKLLLEQVRLWLDGDADTDTKIARFWKVAQPQVSLAKSSSMSDLVYRRWLRRSLDAAYLRGLVDGKAEIQGLILDESKLLYSVSTDKAIANLFGVTNQTVSNWRKGHGTIRKATLVRFLNNRASAQIRPVLEFEEIYPVKVGNEFRIDEENVDDLRQRLSKKKGIYAFYDSAGRVIYVGKTVKGNADLYREIRQRLKGLSKQTIYHRSGNKLRKSRIQYGRITRGLSAYEVKDIEAIHNLEVLLLRTFANDHRNSNLGHFKFLGSV